MTKPEIIGSGRSTYTRVVRMVCEEKAIDYVRSERMLRREDRKSMKVVPTGLCHLDRFEGTVQTLRRFCRRKPCLTEELFWRLPAQR